MIHASLAYRKNETAILRGDVPEKYLRLLPHIPGERIIELGSAEGVLALLLARDGRHVTALEAKEERHQAALELRDSWLRSGLLPETARIEHVRGRAQEAARVLESFDTLVAVRMIYYLRDDLDEVFAAIAEKIPNVVLCGNGNRAARYHAGKPDEPLGEWNFYASVEGMTALLTRHGYTAEVVEPNGDPIVVGRK